MCPFEYDQVYECTSVISSMKPEDLMAVTTKINIFNTTKPKSGTSVRTNCAGTPCLHQRKSSVKR
jgi:hypothetical protein